MTNINGRSMSKRRAPIYWRWASGEKPQVQQNSPLALEKRGRSRPQYGNRYSREVDVHKLEPKFPEITMVDLTCRCSPQDDSDIKPFSVSVPYTSVQLAPRDQPPQSVVVYSYNM